MGLPNAGKTTLFNALTKAGAEITAYASQTDKSNVGMATIADDRLDRLAELVGAKKVTPAAVRVQDVPGTGPALLGGLRQVDALLAVADGFSGNGDPESDIETLKLELLVADTRPRREAARADGEAGEIGRSRRAQGGGGAERGPRAPRGREAADRMAARAAARARPADDEAPDRDRQRARRDRLQARGGAGRAAPTRRRRRSATAPRRSTRSCGG